MVQNQQQIIDKYISSSFGELDVNIDYSELDNFVHYSSATERLKNFKYKIELVEYYNNQITTLNSVSESSEVNTNKALYRKYKDNVIGGFDGFETFLYKEQTGSFYTHGITGSAVYHNKWSVEPWPKINYSVTSSKDGLYPGAQYKLHPSTATVVTDWYDGLLASASLWDTHNNNALIKAVPEHIREDNNNSEFETFVHMIGHHYDILWTYVKHQSDIWNRQEHPAHGMSKDLLYDAAESLGWSLINGNQSERLFEYLLGTNELGEFGKINERKLDKDLYLYIPFDEGRPDFARQNFIDYSGNTNLLEDYVEPTFTKGKHGSGAKFNGNHFLKYQTTQDWSSMDFAVSFWVKDLDATNAKGYIFSSVSGSDVQTAGADPDAGWGVIAEEGQLKLQIFYTGSAGTSEIALPNTTVNKFSSSYLDASSLQGTSTGGKSNGWHHVLFNIDRSGNGTAYHNNQLITTVDISDSASIDIGPNEYHDMPKPILGAMDINNTGTPYHFLTGSLDEFRIYRKHLSADERTELYDDVGVYVTQSMQRSFATPREELTHQVWRRIVNNLPHLLKTKGTSRSVKALLACYGIPESLLSIREYGGPKMPSTVPAAIEERFAYALEVPRGGYLRWNAGRVTSSIKGTDPSGTPYSWGQYLSHVPTTTAGATQDVAGMPIQTREIRLKPAQKDSQWIYVSIDGNTAFARMKTGVALEYTASYSGSDEYGRVHYFVYDSGSKTDWMPIFNGEFWNIAWGYQVSAPAGGWGVMSDSEQASARYNSNHNYNYDRPDGNAKAAPTTYKVRVQHASDYVEGKIIHQSEASWTPRRNGGGTWAGFHGASYGGENWEEDGAQNLSSIAGHTAFLFGPPIPIGRTSGTGGGDTWALFTSSFMEGSTVNPTGASGSIAMYSGSAQEYREWLEHVGEREFDMHTHNARSVVSALSPSGSWDSLVRHYPMGTNQIGLDHSSNYIMTSSHPAWMIRDFQPPRIGYTITGSTGTETTMSYTTYGGPKNRYGGPFNNDTYTDWQVTPGSTSALEKVMDFWPDPIGTAGGRASHYLDHYERIDETYYIHGPSIGGKNLKSSKIRLEDNYLVHPLNRETRGEVSQYDTVSNDSNRLGIFFSPQDMINKDIFNTLGDTALDDFFGSAEDQYKDNYPRYKKFAQTYWKKYENDNDINAYIRIFSLFDFSFFQQVKQLIPVRTNADTGLIVEPSVLERSKVMVEAEPKKEELHWGDNIPDPFPDPKMYVIPQTASIDKLEPMNAEPMHYTSSITHIWSGSAVPMHYTSSVPGQIYTVSGEDLPLSASVDKKVCITSGETIGETSSFSTTKLIIPSGENIGYTGSLNKKVYAPSAESVAIVTIITSSVYGGQVSDPGLDLFKIRSGYPGATYRHISLLKPASINSAYSNTWITQSRHELEYAATGSHVYEQRKSQTFRKKKFYYFPEDDVSRFYPMNKFVQGKILDKSKGSGHHMSRSMALDYKNTSVVYGVNDKFRFETVTHNGFTGPIMANSGSISSSIKARGTTTINIPRWSPEKKGQWSLAFLMKEAPGYSTTGSVLMGQDVTDSDPSNPGWFAPMIFMGSSVNSISSAAAVDMIGMRDEAKQYWIFDRTNHIGDLAYGNRRDEPNHIVITWDGLHNNSTGTGSLSLYINGRHHDTILRSGSKVNEAPSGSFFIENLFGSYLAGGGDWTSYGYSGSLGCVRMYDKMLSKDEIRYLNKYPQLRANRDIDANHGRGREIMTRRIRSNGFASPLTDLGTYSTSHSLVAADYRDDPMSSVYYEGSKLTAPNINEPTENDIDGEEVIKITKRNRYNLIYKKDLPGGGNLDVK